MAAVAETAGTRREMILGNIRAISTNLTSVDDTDTWDPGLAIIEFMTFSPTTAAATTQWGATITTNANRQSRVTFAIESGTLEGTAVAYGF